MSHAHSTASVPVKINVGALEKGIPVLFEPRLEHAFNDSITLYSNIINLKRGVSSRTCVTITNNSNQDIKLPGRMLIGELNCIKSITPADVKLQSMTEEKDVFIKKDETKNKHGGNNNDIQKKSATPSDEVYFKQLKKIDLSMLSENQQVKVREMLYRRCQGLGDGNKHS